MKKTFITVIGNIASGKSTVAKFLADNLKAKFIAADELYKTNPFFKDTLKDRKRWSLASDLWFLVKRAELAEGFAESLNKEIVVQDSGLLMSWVYADSRLRSLYMDENEMSLYNILFLRLTNTLPKENLVVYLRLPASILLERIRKRARDFELQFHTPEYLNNISKSLDDLIKKIQKKTNVLIFDKENWCDIISIEEDRERLLNRVKREIEKSY